MTEAPPHVSVLIPTFARPDNLRIAAESVLAQTQGDFELLIGDDGDLGREVAESLGDERVRYIRNPPPAGIAHNWNRLMDAARGRHLALLMDDDVWEPQFLERCLAAVAEDVGVVFSNHSWARPDGSRETRDVDLRGGTYADFAATFARVTPVAVSAALIRREAWADVRPLPDTAAADMVLFGRLAERGWGFTYVDEPLMAYALHPDNFSRRGTFSDDSVVAWSELSFSDPEAERARRARLARALHNRTTHHLRHSRWKEARADVLAARSLGARSKRQLALELATVGSVTGRLARAALLRRRPADYVP